jgi:chromate transporter
MAARLGVTSFDGPTTHRGYFHAEYGAYRHWLDEQTDAALVALGQFLPGPASSQVGIAIDIFRAGLLGGLMV